MKVVRLSTLRTGRLYNQEIFLVLIYVRGWINSGAIVRPEELCERKIPVKPLGIETVTFRLVAQCLNQVCHRVPIHTHTQRYFVVEVLCSSNIDNFSNFVLSTLHNMLSNYYPIHVHTFFAFPPHVAHCWARVCDFPLQILRSGHFLCVQNTFYIFQEVKLLSDRTWSLRTETDPITTKTA